MSHPVRVKSTLGDDALLFKSLELTEELGRLFICELELFTTQSDIEIDDVLAQEMTVEIDLPNESKRHVHGFVSDMTLTGQAGEYFTYTVTLRPWLWFLTRISDCRIFQKKTVPEIVMQVFRDAGFSGEIKETLTASYRVWEYCVQYKETAFNFVSRLMEQEGIYYYFEHTDGLHTLVLADAPSAHSPIDGYAEVPYYPPSQGAHKPESISDWELSKSVLTGKYRLNAFHFKKPRTSLESKATISFPHPHANYEFFEYPGEHYELAEGKRYVALRMEEVAAQHECVTGRTDAMGLYAGGLFTLAEHPRENQNREYLITSARHWLSIGSHGSSGATTADYEFQCDFDAIPSQVAFRAERITPKPAVQGPQTAIVCGAAGEEIDTDEFGRVKVQFRWDSKGQSNENSSCWVRVAQVWAGAGWGGMTIPRIGQEVIVDFIEGDPDRPIVTGRVYNADNMPPHPLPANKTRSTIMSRSTKGGSAANFNEIRFEDKKGAEEMYIHAEKDQNILVENNQNIKVGFSTKDKGDRSEEIFNDRSLTVGRDKSESVGRNKTITVTADHQEKVGKSMSVMVAKNLTETVGINYAETVGAAMELTVGGALTVSVGAAMSETVGATKSESVGGTKSESVGSTKTVDIGKDLVEEVQANAKLTVGKDMEELVQGKRRVEVTKEFSLKAKKIDIIADDEISLTAGSAKIVLKKNGDITVSGKKIEIKGSGDVVVKGSNVKEN
jgi:type VI secretion system secreted protein VgrG